MEFLVDTINQEINLNHKGKKGKTNYLKQSNEIAMKEVINIKEAHYYMILSIITNTFLL